MRRFFAVTLFLAMLLTLSVGSFSALADGICTIEADDVLVDAPCQEILMHDPFGGLYYNAADRYYIANGTEITLRISLPEGTNPAMCFVQCAYDWWQPVIMNTLPMEDGYYVYTTNIDSVDTTGYYHSDVQFYINQVPNPDQVPNLIFNFYASEADADAFCADFQDVTWSYANAGGMEGDINGDDEITSADALIGLRYAMGLTTLSDEEVELGDVNNDGVLDTIDALLLLRFSLGLINEF